jgi:hypothetical protein
MLISLVALAVMVLSVGVRRMLTGGPIVLEITPTWELALIAVGVLVAYGVATRWIWQRPPVSRVVDPQMLRREKRTATVESTTPDAPTRGAA